MNRLRANHMRYPLVVLLLAGCSSTGIVPADRGTYLVSKQSAAGMFGTPNGVKADIYREATAFCEKKNLDLETITVETKSAIPAVRQGSASLHFRCVPRDSTASK